MGSRTGKIDQDEINQSVENLLRLCPMMSEFMEGLVKACEARAESIERIGRSAGEDEVILTSINWQWIADELREIKDGVVKDIEKRGRDEFCPSQITTVASALNIPNRALLRAINNNVTTLKGLREAEKELRSAVSTVVVADRDSAPKTAALPNSPNSGGSE